MDPLYIVLPLAAAILSGAAVFLWGWISKHPDPSDAPRFRACPVCGKELPIGENILAERTGVVKEGRERIIIKGCTYCLGRKRQGLAT